jgi:formamidopyrimidine-DNA glycosylase
MPHLAEFSYLVHKRKGAAIKALLLDQSFSAGIGNWIAGEKAASSRTWSNGLINLHPR